MRKISCLEEINFDTSNCEETRISRLLHYRNIIKNFKNPYIGNKRDLIIDLVKALDKNDIQYDSILDLFCGSACVSMIMKMIGKRVVANDILSSSAVYAEAFVKNNSVEISQDESEFITKNESPHSNFVLDNFLDRFSVTEAGHLDRIYENIYQIFNTNSDIHKTKRALVFANLQLFIMDRCFIGGRLNSGQILAHFDHRLKHSRNSGQEMNFNQIKWKNLNIAKDIGGHEVYSKDCIDLLKNDKPKIDLAYIDPPYGTAQSDYVMMYSFFESYMKQKMDIFGENEKKFINVSNYEDNFRQLIYELSYIPAIAISYNNSSWYNINKIK